MADKKATIVIKKVKKGGHGGAHGGAWKVAFADFMTAMMCFFLVMWLMGSDEETKASIASYFNNPNSPEAWRPDLHERDAIPLGNKTGAGENLLKGAEGQVPEDLLQRPSPVIERKPDNEGPVDKKGVFSSEDLDAAETMSYAFYESQLFRPGTPDIALPDALNALNKVGKIALNFHGSLVIRGHYDELAEGGYELGMSRLVELKKYIVGQRWLADDLIRVKLGKQVTKGEARFLFTFSKDSALDQ
jgi:hypothetical protein